MSFKFQFFSIFISVFILQSLLNPGSFAHAKRKAPLRAFSFITTNGKASQRECDGETKIPRKLKHLKEMAKADSYTGSELLDSEIKAKADDELWKHVFKNKASCNAILAKTPSSVEETKRKNQPELPPDDSTESSGDEEEGNSSDAE